MDGGEALGGMGGVVGAVRRVTEGKVRGLGGWEGWEWCGVVVLVGGGGVRWRGL